MSAKEPKNVAASILARLRNHSASSGSPFQQVLQQYAIERFLYRISKSQHAEGVILKGALLLKTIGIPRARPTMDIDMLRRGKADRATLTALVKDCAALEVDPDGLSFVADSIVAEEITKDSEYAGTRVLMGARLGNVRLRIQIDFGVGDVMVPGPRMIEYPTFLDRDSIQLLAYPVQSAIAEKLQAMVALGDANSRMKDFYDIWVCSKHLEFDANRLLDAIKATFQNRETPIPHGEFEALTIGFAERHRAQWNAFVKKMGQREHEDGFVKIVSELRTFVTPLLHSLTAGGRLNQVWKPDHGWAHS
jgi:hypothetical protein